jgi:hypothetical protein
MKAFTPLVVLGLVYTWVLLSPAGSWKTYAKDPPDSRATVDELALNPEKWERSSVEVSGKVVRVYGPGIAAYRTTSGRLMLILAVGNGEGPKLNRPYHAFMSIQDCLSADVDESMFPAVPHADLEKMDGLPVLQAYKSL